MLSSRLTARCRSARVIGTAIAQDHAIEFSKKSIDGSGKANLIQQDRVIGTPGVLFEISLFERDALDKAEGAGSGYDRLDEFVVETTNDRESVNATTYLASSTQTDLLPFDWYLALVLAGTLEHRIGDDHADHLRSIAFHQDLDQTRKSRIAALKALSDHGYHDHMTLLRR